MSTNSSPKSLTTALRSILTGAEAEEREAAGLSSWVHSVATTHGDNQVKAFVSQVDAIRHRKQNVRAQLKQLEILLQGADPHICELECQLDQSVLPLSTENRKTATAVDGLLKVFAQSYFEAAEMLGNKWFRVLYARQQPLAALRAAQLIHRRALIAYRVYSNGSPQRWKQYRALLAMTQEERSANSSAHSAASNDAQAIALTVAQSALMTLSDPTTLNENDITCVRLYAERYGHLVNVLTAPPELADQTPGVFILTSKGPCRPTSAQAKESGHYYFDTRPLLTKLDQQIAGLQQGERSAQLGLPATTRDSAYLPLLTNCRAQWSEPRKRLHTRNGVQPRADLVAGFDAVLGFVAQNALKRRRTDDVQAGKAIPTSEWAIIDQSEGGFGLRFVKGAAGTIAVGELIALRFKDSASVVVCISRRARSVSGSEFEVGVELLSERPFVAAVSDPRSQDPARRLPMLLLSRLANQKGATGALVGANEATQGLTLTVRNNGTPVRLCSTEVIEQLASCALIGMAAQAV